MDGEPVTKHELHLELNALEERINARAEALEERMLARIEKVETNLLKAFRSYAVRENTRLTANTVLVNSFDERLTMLENRMDDWEAGGR